MARRLRTLSGVTLVSLLAGIAVTPSLVPIRAVVDLKAGAAEATSPVLGDI